MFRKSFATTLFLIALIIVALGATACGQVQLPASLPQLPTDSQPSLAPNPTMDNAPAALQPTAPSTAPSSGPQAGRNLGKGGKVQATLFEMFHRLGWEAGIVAKTSSDQITLRTIKSGSAKIKIGASTILIVPGNPTATLADVHVGDRVIANVPKGSDTAALVMDVPRDYDKDNLLLGMVQSNSAGSVTLRTRGGSDTLNTTAATQVVKVNRDGVTAGTVNDLQNGNLVVAIGQTSRENFETQAIFVLPKGVLELGKQLGKDRKNLPPPPPPAPNPGG